jgi:hypothetical protein
MNDDSSSKLEGDLLTAAVMQCSVGDLQKLVEELRREVSLMRSIMHSSLEVMKCLCERFLELIEAAGERRLIEKTIRRIAREAARTQLPLWFWRPEPELGIEGQLTRRVTFLIDEAKLLEDDQWDLIREYVDDWAKVDVADDFIESILDRLHEERGAV